MKQLPPFSMLAADGVVHVHHADNGLHLDCGVHVHAVRRNDLEFCKRAQLTCTHAVSRALNHWQNFHHDWGRDGGRGDEGGDDGLWKLPVVKPGYLKLHVTQLVRTHHVSVHERISVMLWSWWM